MKLSNQKCLKFIMPIMNLAIKTYNAVQHCVSLRSIYFIQLVFAVNPKNERITSGRPVVCHAYHYIPLLYLSLFYVFCAETKSEVTLSAHRIFSEFFTAQVLTELCRQLVLNYFPLRDDELKCWLTDPENFSESE